MKDSKKVVKSNPVIVALQAIDKTEGELHALGQTKHIQYGKFATLLLRKQKKGITKLNINAEATRLITIAKGIVSDAHYTPKHEELKNIWSATKNIMKVRMAKKICPDAEIVTVAGRDDKGNTVTAKVKVKDIPTSYSGISKHASALNKVIDASDKRSTNAPKTKKTRAPQQPKGAPQNPSATTAKGWTDSLAFGFKTVKGAKAVCEGIIHHRAKVTEFCKSLGWAVTFTKIVK